MCYNWFGFESGLGLGLELTLTLLISFICHYRRIVTHYKYVHIAL